MAFTNKAISFQEFSEMKESIPSGQLPLLEIEDEATGEKKVLDQSNAITRYVGKLGGLYPTDPVAALEVDIVIDTVEEASKFIVYTLAGPKGIFFTDESHSAEEKIAIRTKMMDPTIKDPKNAAFVSKLARTRRAGSDNALEWSHVMFETRAYF